MPPINVFFSTGVSFPPQPPSPHEAIFSTLLAVIVLGFSTVHLPIPFALGVAPGCIWKVVPTAQVPIASRLGGTGSSTFLFDLALAPRGVRFYLQALTTCVVEGGIPGEHAASDAWELTIR